MVINVEAEFKLMYESSESVKILLKSSVVADCYPFCLVDN